MSLPFPRTAPVGSTGRGRFLFFQPPLKKAMKLHLTSIAALIAAGALAHADLVAHYDFDTIETSGGVSTTDEVTTGGTNFATGGSRATFDQSRRRLGTGSLVLKSVGGTEVAGNDGAVSSNTFEALDDAAILALYQNAQTNGPQVIFLEPDLPVSPPGAARTLRFQLSSGVTTASIDQGLGSVLPVDSVGYGTVAVSPAATTEYTLDTLRGTEASQAKTSIRVSSEPLVLNFVYGPQPGRARMFVFMPDPTKNYYLTRSADLADGFPFTVSTFLLPAVPYQEVFDNAAPADRAFYRLEQEDVPTP